MYYGAMFPIRIFPQEMRLKLITFMRLRIFVILYYHQCIQREGGVN